MRDFQATLVQFKNVASDNLWTISGFLILNDWIPGHARAEDPLMLSLMCLCLPSKK